MGELTQHTILQLKQGISGEELVHASRITSDLIIKALHPNYTSGFADTDAEEVTQEEREQLLDALISQLSRVQTEEDILSIIFALGKSDEVRYKEIYSGLLQKSIDELTMHNSLVFQLLIALSNAGFDVFEHDPDGSSSQSILNIEKNLRQAERFLQQPPRKRRNNKT